MGDTGSDGVVDELADVVGPGIQEDRVDARQCRSEGHGLGEVQPDRGEAVDRQYTGLPVDRYPMIVGMREALLSGGDRDGWALHVLINGILNTPARTFR